MNRRTMYEEHQTCIKSRDWWKFRQTNRHRPRTVLYLGSGTKSGRWPILLGLVYYNISDICEVGLLLLKLATFTGLS